jgi:DNA repair exonuclease SbcCD ATPase subunit
MLFIRKIKYKNILSSGNQFTEIDFNSYKTTLIRGNSGQGKSLIITALIFGLYGKSNRGTTKKQLVNTVNKKDCLVEVEFDNDGKEFKIRRGISPNIFEIYINNKLQEELSAVKDQQKYLEQNILKMSFRTFMQVVVLGSNNYTPFMQLSAADRRDLVEEILDIKIFSSMNSLLKDKIKSVSQKLKEIEISKISIEDKIEMQKGFIHKIKNDGEILIQEKEDEISALNSEILNYNSNLEDLVNELEEVQTKSSSITFSSKKLKSLLGLDGKVEQRKNSIQEEIDFFKTHSVCPTCKQDLQVEFKNEKVKEISKLYDELIKNHQELIEAIQQEEEKEKLLEETNRKINILTSNIKNIKNKIALNQKNIDIINNEIKHIHSKIDNQSEEEEILSGLKKEKAKLVKTYNKCKEALHYFEFSHLLMKDGGIKSKIIQKYLPIINIQINKYLQMMDLYINFNLDEEFKETIQTPLHEGFSYSSFSEGEKQRINLATILAWREISRIKNSANCNLIFFDETLDSSLDASGIDDFLKIINYVIDKANIFVISHREGFDDRFNKVLEVKKINGFSKVFS